MSVTHSSVTLADVEAARRVIEGVVLRTPMLPAPKLSALTGAEVYVKYENLQVTNSFKDRGALVKLVSLSAADRKRGVITMSAGNHAQAVAYHSARLGIPATIVMPVTTPFVKTAATRSHGAEVVFVRRDRWPRRRRAARRSRRSEASYSFTLTTTCRSSPGRARSGWRFSTNCPQVEAIVVPLGGGGLIAGIFALAVKSLADVQIIGVEAARLAAASVPRHEPPGRIRSIFKSVRHLADGLAVGRVGELAVCELARGRVDRVVTSGQRGGVCSLAVLRLLEYGKERGRRGRRCGHGRPAWPASCPELAGRRTVALILSGGNIDPRVLASIMVRELEREERIVSFRLTIPDQPGVLGIIATRLGGLGANILEVDHRRLFLDVPAKGAKLDVTLETRDAAHAEEIMAALAADGYAPMRLAAVAAITARE